MDFIKPIQITDSLLISSSVSEDDYDEYDSETAYLAEEYIQVSDTDIHKVYKCAVACTDKYPPDNIYDDSGDEPTGYWIEVSATNRWKMFDGKSRAATKNATEIVVEISPGTFYNAVSLINTSAQLVTVQEIDPEDGVVYQRTQTTEDDSDIVDFYTWINFPIKRKSKFVFTDLPAYSTTTVRVIIQATDETVEVGELVVGIVTDIGVLQEEYDVGFEDWSVKDKDEEGNPTLEEGEHADTAKFTVAIPHTAVYSVKRAMAENRATAIVFIGYEAQQETIIYGWLVSFKATVRTTSRAYYTIEVEELS